MEWQAIEMFYAAQCFEWLAIIQGYSDVKIGGLLKVGIADWEIDCLLNLTQYCMVLVLAGQCCTDFKSIYTEEVSGQH